MILIIYDTNKENHKIYELHIQILQLTLLRKGKKHSVGILSSILNFGGMDLWTHLKLCLRPMLVYSF